MTDIPVNLRIYEKVRSVPKEAQKTIAGGRLRGFTDINPMWRIKTLTEHFGPCGEGWYWVTTEDKVMEAGTEVKVFVRGELFVKYDGEWSQPIEGRGGSSFISIEKEGPRANDECFKMAETDALSVACKKLGIGADIYWSNDKSKYDVPPDNEAVKPTPQTENSKKMEQKPEANFTTADKVTEPSPVANNLAHRKSAISLAIENDDTNTLEAIAKDILLAHDCKMFATCSEDVLSLIEQAFTSATHKPMPADREAVVNEIVTLKATKLTVKKAVDEFMKKVQKMFLRDLTDGELYEVWKLVEDIKKVKA